MKAVVAVIKSLFFAIKLPLAYQMAVSYPLPPPTTLIGALACSYSKIHDIQTSWEGDGFIEDCVRYVLDSLRLVTVKPLSPIWRKSFLLSRLRVLEKSTSKVEGKRLSDAMTREYFGGRLALVYVFNDEKFATDAYKALYLVERVGDTESLVSVESVQFAEVEPLKSSSEEVDTYFPLRSVRFESLRGRFQLYDMHPMEFAAKVKREVKDVQELETYVLPLSEAEKSILWPATVKAEVADGYCFMKIRSSNFDATAIGEEL